MVQLSVAQRAQRFDDEVATIPLLAALVAEEAAVDVIREGDAPGVVVAEDEVVLFADDDVVDDDDDEEMSRD